MSTKLFFNGKPVKVVPKTGILVRVVNEKYYEDAAYSKKQQENTSKYFAKQAEYREDLNLRHG